MRAVPRYHLAGPHGRRYEFIPVEDAVLVRRFESEQKVREEELSVPQARSRYAYLRKLGYRLEGGAA